MSFRLNLRHSLFLSCIAATGLLGASSAHAAVINFDGAEYTAPNAVLGVDDANVSANANKWTLGGGTGSLLGLSAGTGVGGSFSARISDNTTTSFARAGIDMAGTVDMTQPFVVGLSLKSSLSAAAPLNSALHTNFQFGSGSIGSKSWASVSIDGDQLYLYVDNAAGTIRQGVPLGAYTADTFVSLSLTVDPVSKTYTNVLYTNGLGVTTDVTAAVTATNGGTIPWLHSSAVLPDTTLQISTGVATVNNADFDNISVAAVPEPTALAIIAIGGGLLAARRRKAFASAV